MSEAVQKLLAMDTWAIVGLSTNPRRAAYGVAKFLQDNGKRIVPVHPAAPVVYGEQGYATLAEIPFAVDVVDCFVRSELVGPVVDQAACRRAQDAGLVVVMDRCPKIDWSGYRPR